MGNKKKIAFVVATPLTAKSFLSKHFEALVDIYDVYLIANFKDEDLVNNDFGKVIIIDIPIKRNISILEDLYALIKLLQVLRKYKFDIIHSVTPKAGLLAMIASSIIGVSYRFHTFTGQVWVSYSGFKRYFFKVLDKIIVACSTNILIDSESQRGFLIKEGVIKKSKSKVLGEGSISGVDIKRFSPSASNRDEVRQKLGVDENDFVFIFLGRVNKDKGIIELLNAFNLLSSEHFKQSIKLIIIGPDEENLLLNIDNKNVIIQGYTDEPHKFMACADVFCLPSHREGFGSVLIEAAAAGLPAIASNIYGITDAVKDGETGLLHRAGDSSDIITKMRLIIENPELKERLANAGRKRAINFFDQKHITKELIDFYSTVSS